MNRKRSTRIATKESEEEEKARIAAERAAEASKLSRASRHKIIANLNGEDSTSDASSSKGGAPETREERLKKREEEKRAREAAIEAAQIEQIRKMEREAAIASNGGVVPAGLETEEELKEQSKEEEKETQRVAREQARMEKEAAAEAAVADKTVKQPTPKGKSAKPVKASPAPPPPALVEVVSEEPPWYLDCEICKDAGWNLVSLDLLAFVEAELIPFS